MAEAADTNDADFLAWTAALELQGGVDGDTSAKHGRSIGAVQFLGDGNGEVCLCSVESLAPRMFWRGGGQKYLL